MTTSLLDYLRAEIANGHIDHTLRATLLPGGDVGFYIHAANASSQTTDVVVHPGETPGESVVRTRQMAGETRVLTESGLSFGGALSALKAGRHVAREGWNGKNMHLYLATGGEVEVEDADGSSRAVRMEPCVVMFTAQGKHQPGWLASQNDMLASDWVVVSEAAPAG